MHGAVPGLNLALCLGRGRGHGRTGGLLPGRGGIDRHQGIALGVLARGLLDVIGVLGRDPAQGLAFFLGLAQGQDPGNIRDYQERQDQDGPQNPPESCRDVQGSFLTSGQAGQFGPHQPLQFGPVFFKVLEIFLQLHLGAINGNLALIELVIGQGAHLVARQG